MDILAAVLAIGDDDLSSVLNVTVISQPAATVNQSIVSTVTGGSCPAGSYCPPGSVSPLPCPGGTQSNASIPIMTSAAECIRCALETYCPVGSDREKNCSAGNYNPFGQQDTCRKCAAGTHQDEEGTTACKACVTGAYCPQGAAAPLSCLEGTFSTATSLTSADECTPTNPGFYVPTGSATQMPCAPGTFAADASSGKCLSCPAGNHQDKPGSTTCKKCSSGSYCSAHSNETDASCHGGLTGVFCRLCKPRDDGKRVYFSQATTADRAQCKDCRETARDTILTSLGVVLGVAVVAFLTYTSFGAFASDRRKEQLGHAWQAFKPHNKLKIIIGFYKIASKTPKIYDVELPAAVKRLLITFSYGASFLVLSFNLPLFAKLVCCARCIEPFSHRPLELSQV